MHDYVVPYLGNQNDKKGTPQLRAFSWLASRSLVKVIDYLESWLPFELEARYVTAYISKRYDTTYSCKQIIGSVSSDQSQIQNICGLWNFNDIEDMRLWYGGKYYGKDSRQFNALIRITGLTQE